MDNFASQVRALSQRVEKLIPNIQTEEATKTSLIMPFFQILGYDVFNPEEFLPEYVADVGIKKGEKVDYAIMQDNSPMILIEAKSVNQKLEKHDSQLFRYFGTTKAKFAILTNGLIYRFYTDLEEQNKMDSTPFFEFNITELRDNQLAELSKFRKAEFDVEHILTSANELKYTNEITKYLSTQWENPDEDFVSFLLTHIYAGKKTKAVVEKFQPVVKKSLKLFLNDTVNDKLKAALNNTNSEAVKQEVAATTTEAQKESETPPAEPVIETTEEELEGYITVKLLLNGEIAPERVFYRDNQSYFNILLDDSIRKWIVRLGFNTQNKWIQLNDEEKSTFNINSVNEIVNYKDKIVEVAKKFS